MYSYITFLLGNGRTVRSRIILYIWEGRFRTLKIDDYNYVVFKVKLLRIISNQAFFQNLEIRYMSWLCFVFTIWVWVRQSTGPESLQFIGIDQALTTLALQTLLILCCAVYFIKPHTEVITPMTLNYLLITYTIYMTYFLLNIAKPFLNWTVMDSWVCVYGTYVCGMQSLWG